jgi:hypothetical protein
MSSFFVRLAAEGSDACANGLAASTGPGGEGVGLTGPALGDAAVARGDGLGLATGFATGDLDGRTTGTGVGFEEARGVVAGTPRAAAASTTP